MLKRQPPVGSPVLLKPIADAKACFELMFADDPVYAYVTGTMALAAALIAAKTCKETTEPEVLLPAYACPDLVSAAVYAGVKPVLVDLEPNRPWMDLEQLQARLNSHTVAVIAVHFLGLTERLDEIRQVIADSNALLIEDSAQLFPHVRVDKVWQGDLVVLSFGRGKPVSLLGGGAVICCNRHLASHLPDPRQALLATERAWPTARFAIKATLYNQLLAPRWYGMLESLPFLHLGETRYKPLKQIKIPVPEFSAMLATNIAAYKHRNVRIQSLISAMLVELRWDSIRNLPIEMNNDPDLLLLRYPILLKTPELRDRLFAKLSKSGFGASKMYPAPLPGIDGMVEKFQSQDHLPNANSFSKRLLTLPCHSGVSNRDIDRIGQVIQQMINI